MLVDLDAAASVPGSADVHHRRAQSQPLTPGWDAASSHFRRFSRDDLEQGRKFGQRQHEYDTILALLQWLRLINKFALPGGKSLSILEPAVTYVGTGVPIRRFRGGDAHPM
ncbi:MAG: hypothetical protein H6661_02345 [Ardenticatenaceae bacterium]|nr:hypothetical protein [Ardenticatenaceae bacterium]